MAKEVKGQRPAVPALILTGVIVYVSVFEEGHVTLSYHCVPVFLLLCYFLFLFYLAIFLPPSTSAEGHYCKSCTAISLLTETNLQQIC